MHGTLTDIPGPYCVPITVPPTERAIKGGHAMGRGRQKAKATRQAREIKYFSPQTDYSALERELSAAKGRRAERDDVHPEEDEYSDYADEYDDPAGER